MSKIIFWGSGEIGKKMHKYWRDHGWVLDYFCNNDEKSWGTIQEGIEIISPTQAVGLIDSIFFITSTAVQEITKQLKQLGVSEERIIRADGFYSKQLIDKIECIYKKKEIDVRKKKTGCYIDLSCGMVLGGVERWSYSLAESLLKKGVQGKYLVPSDGRIEVYDDSYPVKLFSNRDRWIIDECIDELLYGEFANVLCNFPFEIFVAACIVKRVRKNDFNIIAVVHNDEDIYYDIYTQFKDEIDYCLVISSVIKRKMISKGFPESKLIDLHWQINIDNKVFRDYWVTGKPIRIGYAGRIVKHQKRVDLIIEIAKKLRQRGIKFLINLVGTGDYEEELKEQIIINSLEDYLYPLGFVAHSEIMEFWSRQDICISCSEFEGHSISHSEAMASGTVPIITNTSGAEDDVKNGYNGFVVDIGDIDSMVECIEKLYYDREMLIQMGDRCREIISDRNTKMDIEKFWFPLLKIF